MKSVAQLQKRCGSSNISWVCVNLFQLHIFRSNPRQVWGLRKVGAEQTGTENERSQQSKLVPEDQSISELYICNQGNLSIVSSTDGIVQSNGGCLTYLSIGVESCGFCSRADNHPGQWPPGMFFLQLRQEAKLGSKSGVHKKTSSSTQINED